MKLVIDMNISPRWVEVFATSAIKAVHWASVGSPGAPDREIMAFAQAQGYIVMTHNLDFSAILAATFGTVPSVVQLRAADVSPERLGTRLLALLLEHESLLERGALITVDSDRNRVRLLPLQSAH